MTSVDPSVGNEPALERCVVGVDPVNGRITDSGHHSNSGRWLKGLTQSLTGLRQLAG